MSCQHSWVTQPTCCSPLHSVGPSSSNPTSQSILRWGEQVPSHPLSLPARGGELILGTRLHVTEKQSQDSDFPVKATSTVQGRGVRWHSHDHW